MYSYKIVIALYKNSVKDIGKPVQLCVENFVTFVVEMFLLRTKHIFTFQVQSISKVSVIWQKVTLGNFTNEHCRA